MQIVFFNALTQRDRSHTIFIITYFASKYGHAYTFEELTELNDEWTKKKQRTGNKQMHKYSTTWPCEERNE